MKTILVKLVVALGLVLLVVGGLIFWPTETEPDYTPSDLKTPPQVQQTRVESLYKTALFHKERDNPSEMDFRIMADCCRKILTQYPDTQQAEKAKELLRQHNMTDRQISRLYSSGPAVKKSRTLRRKFLRRDEESYIATYDELKSTN